MKLKFKAGDTVLLKATVMKVHQGNVHLQYKTRCRSPGHCVVKPEQLENAGVTNEPTLPQGRALSVRPIWAHSIIHLGKDIENRNWPMKYRGKIYIHAGKTISRDDIDGWRHLLKSRQIDVPKRKGLKVGDLQRGGFIGTVEIVDCVTHSTSPWFVGDYGFVLKNPQPIEFIPYRGRLGLFTIT